MKHSDLSFSSKLMDMLTIGSKIRLYYGKDNPNNKLYHIRAFIDDEWIVYRLWLKHKKRWHYGIEHLWHFHFAFEAGLLKREGKSKNECSTIVV